MEDSIQTFIDNYSSETFDKIKFDWNGKHGDELIDNNLEFRLKLLEHISSDIKDINIILIRDLYIELSKFGKEGFGAPKYFNILAEELLKRDYKEYLKDYIEGASKSMDTYLYSGRINIPTELAKEIHHYILNDFCYKTDFQEKDLNLFAERFRILSEKT